MRKPLHFVLNSPGYFSSSVRFMQRPYCRTDRPLLFNPSMPPQSRAKDPTSHSRQSARWQCLTTDNGNRQAVGGVRWRPFAGEIRRGHEEPGRISSHISYYVIHMRCSVRRSRQKRLIRFLAVALLAPTPHTTLRPMRAHCTMRKTAWTVL